MKLPRAQAIAIACACALLPACTKPHAAEPESPASVAPSTEPTLFTVPPEQRARLSLVKVEKKDVAPPLHVPAVVTFDDLKTTDVVPLVTGRVEEVMVREGSRVRAGDPLIAIQSPDSSDNSANLRRDEATLKTKTEVLRRDQDLYQHKAISLEELQGAQLDVDSAQAALQDDQAHVRITGSGAEARAILRSPLTGLVVSRRVSVGQAVEAGGDPVFTITDPSLVWVIAHVYPEDIRRVAPGDLAEVHSAALESPLKGRVTYIGAAVDPDTLTVPIRIEVDNRQGALKKGLYVDAEITPSRSEPALLVPVDSILRDDDNLPFVYVAKGDGQFARRHVTIGGKVGGDTIVTSGLDGGETVLGAGALFVQFADSLEH